MDPVFNEVFQVDTVISARIVNTGTITGLVSEIESTIQEGTEILKVLSGFIKAQDTLL